MQRKFAEFFACHGLGGLGGLGGFGSLEGIVDSMTEVRRVPPVSIGKSVRSFVTFEQSISGSRGRGYRLEERAHTKMFF